MSPTLAECVEVLDAAYDPALAEDWDAVGLVLGDPRQRVERVHLAVDPTPEVAAEAAAAGADLLVTHHPLLLKGASALPLTTRHGRVVSELIRNDVALHVAHTNADRARPGVSDALADALGVLECEPLEPVDERWLLLVTYVPAADRDRVLDALAAAGAGRIGRYERCAFTVAGSGTFRPLPGARPAVVSPGAPGSVSRVEEDRLELLLAARDRSRVVRALRQAHPYEEPSFSLLAAQRPGEHGLGRIGMLARPVPLGEFARIVASALPHCAGGVRASGPADRVVRRIAVCGGAGLQTAGAAAALGADVLVTADCRYHTTQDAPLAVLDVSHWASEWPWLAQAGRLLAASLGVETAVSALRTDPWQLHVPGER